MQQQQSKNYASLLQQFIRYKEASLSQKQQMKKEIEKYRLQLQKFITKVDKKIQTRLREDKNVNSYRIQELQTAWKEEVQKLKGLLSQKDRVIDQMRQLVRLLQSQKRQLIQNNTKVLVELSQGIDVKDQQPSQAIDHNYKQLMKMYQYLIEENNQLKKEIYMIQRQNLNHTNHTHHVTQINKNQSFLIKQEKSLNNSQYKSKSMFDHSKAEQPVSMKSHPKKQKIKEKNQKIQSGKTKK